MTQKQKNQLQKLIKKSKISFYDVEDFKQQGKEYFKAIREGRVVCFVEPTASGCSRHIKFLACEKNRNQPGYRYRNFYALMKVMGFAQSRKYNDSFLISGCGMDMVFHTNYTMINDLKYYGVIRNTKEAEQQTPTVI